MEIPQVAVAPWGWLGLVLNVVPWGGVGSIVVGIHARHRGLVAAGILQAVLTIAIAGWVWSVAWGLGIRLRAVNAPQAT